MRRISYTEWQVLRDEFRRRHLVRRCGAPFCSLIGAMLVVWVLYYPEPTPRCPHKPGCCTHGRDRYYFWPDGPCTPSCVDPENQCPGRRQNGGGTGGGQRV